MVPNLRRAVDWEFDPQRLNRQLAKLMRWIAVSDGPIYVVTYGATEHPDLPTFLEAHPHATLFHIQTLADLRKAIQKAE